MQQLLTASSVPAAPCSQRHSSERPTCAFGAGKMAAAKAGHIDVWSSPAVFGAIFSSCRHGVPRQLASQLRHRRFLGPADLSFQLEHFIIWRQTPGGILSWRAAAASAAAAPLSMHEADGSHPRSMILPWDPFQADTIRASTRVVSYACLERRRGWAAAESDVA